MAGHSSGKRRASVTKPSTEANAVTTGGGAETPPLPDPSPISARKGTQYSRFPRCSRCGKEGRRYDVSVAAHDYATLAQLVKVWLLRMKWIWTGVSCLL